MHHDIQFCTTEDGVRIAYAVSGSGPPLVKAATWLSHLEFDRQSPVWHHWISELSRHHTLVRYDERGCGLSDWEVDEFSFEAWVRDLETVVDAVGLDRFTVLGISQGAPVAIRYATRHPDRVEAMVLYGAFARGWRTRDEQHAREGEHLMELMRSGWGRPNPAFRQLFTGLFIPEADQEQIRSFNELQRISTSSKNAVRFMEEFGEIDVTDDLEDVRSRTLVVHARQDAVAPFEEGRQVAAGIPGSRFVALEGQNHILTAGETAWDHFLAEVRRFLGVPVDTGEAEVDDARERAEVDAGLGTEGPAARGDPGGRGNRSSRASGDSAAGHDAVGAGAAPRAGEGIADGDDLISRLKRRKIGQWGLAYVAGAWVALEALSLVADPWGIPGSVHRGLQVALVAGLPLSVVLAWYHGESGRQRVKGRELLVVAVVLAMAALLMVVFVE